MQKSQLGALIITMLLFASCSSGARTSPPAMNNQVHPAPFLAGRWRQVSPADEEVTMAFTSDGKLIYSVHAGGKTQVINMVYEVSGNQIITDQPSNPRRKISRFSFEPSGILVLDYNGEEARFRRGVRPAKKTNLSGGPMRWLLESVWSPVGSHAYVTFLVDPQFDGMRRKGEAVWAVMASPARPVEWLQVDRTFTLSLGPGWKNRLPEFFDHLSSLRNQDLEANRV